MLFTGVKRSDRPEIGYTIHRSYPLSGITCGTDLTIGCYDIITGPSPLFAKDGNQIG